MAEPDKNQSSSTHKPYPKPPKHHAAGKSPNKGKTTSSAAAPPPFKRPLLNLFPENPEFNNDTTHVIKTEPEEDDTGTFKMIKDDIQVKVPDSTVMIDLVAYHKKYGVYPFDDPHHMKKFCCMWIPFGYGNADGWNAKMEHLKNKFKNHTESTVDGLERAEFQVWKAIFGHETGKSPNKINTNTSTASQPPSKRPLVDTATSEIEKQKEADIEVGLIDIVVLNDLYEYHEKYGVYPFDDPNHMKRFCSGWIRSGFGNAGGWKVKIEHLKNKFKNHTACTVDPEQRAEFIKWNMIFGDH